MEPYLGEIKLFGGNFAPEGWAFCNGQLLAISQHEQLYSLLGTRFGGDGRTSFGLPNLCGRLPLHQGTSTTSGSSYVLGQQGGQENVTLLQSQLPAHSHQALAASASNRGTPQSHVWAGGTEVALYASSAPNSSMGAQAISVVGGNLPHENGMPALAVTFIISLVGIYPSES